jgi:hypothetical protein
MAIAMQESSLRPSNRESVLLSLSGIDQFASRQLHFPIMKDYIENREERATKKYDERMYNDVHC